MASSQAPMNTVYDEDDSDVDDVPVTEQEDPDYQSGKPVLDLVDAFKPTGLNFGEVTTSGTFFVPFMIVAKYAYICGGIDREKVRVFMKDNLFSGHCWDVFAQLDPHGVSQPIILAKSAQFSRFLQRAGYQLETKLDFPKGSIGEICYLEFGESGTPQPRFLGRADSIKSFFQLKDKASQLPADDLSGLDWDCFTEYMGKMQTILNVLKHEADAKYQKQKKVIAARVDKQKNWGRMVKRAQRYLGLYGKQEVVPPPFSAAWDVSKPPPFMKQQNMVRLVSVDIEAYERQPGIITEIGIAMLDSSDILRLGPGNRGEDWFKKIHAHHLIINEYSHLKNSRFIEGCPDAFHFGTSEKISIHAAGQAIHRIIMRDKDKGLPVVMVGHDIGMDLEYLRKVEFNAWHYPDIKDDIDTKFMHQRMERGTTGRKLQMICSELGVPGYDYHNAGNDAVYTLRAMIAMAVKRTVEGSDRGPDACSLSEDEWTDEDDGGAMQRTGPKKIKTKEEAMEAAPYNFTPMW